MKDYQYAFSTVQSKAIKYSFQENSFLQLFLAIKNSFQLAISLLCDTIVSSNVYKFISHSKLNTIIILILFMRFSTYFDY